MRLVPQEADYLFNCLNAMNTISTHALRFFGVVLATLGIVLVFLVGSAHAQVFGGGSTGIEWYTFGSPYMVTTATDVYGAGVYSRMGMNAPWLPGGYYPNALYWMQQVRL